MLKQMLFMEGHFDDKTITLSGCAISILKPFPFSEERVYLEESKFRWEVFIQTIEELSHIDDLFEKQVISFFHELFLIDNCKLPVLKTIESYQSFFKEVVELNPNLNVESVKRLFYECFPDIQIQLEKEVDSERKTLLFVEDLDAETKTKALPTIHKSRRRFSLPNILNSIFEDMINANYYGEKSHPQSQEDVVERKTFEYRKDDNLYHCVLGLLNELEEILKAKIQL